jgi:predicted  nucleic acid-binding Zn-ribbon protein
MESSSANSLDIFGQRCAKVKAMVDIAASQRKFCGPVFGPIGFYCKVIPGKEEFAALAESALGPGVLDRFVVCNDADRKLFQKIRRDAGCQSDCGVFQQAPHSRYNIPDPPQIEGIETIHSVLSVQNDLVFNCMVDNCKIDEKALTRSKEDGEQKLLIRGENGRKNAIRGNRFKEVFFLPKGDNWRVTKGGNIQMISNTRPRMKHSIGVDTHGAIREAKIEYESLKEEHAKLDREYSRLEHEHTEMKKVWNGHKRELLKIKKGIDDTEKDIEALKASESAAADMDEDTAMEEQDVAEAQEALDEIRETLAKSKYEVEHDQPQIEEIEAKLKEVTARNEKVLADLGKAENDLTRFYARLTQQKEKLEKKRKKLEQYEQVISEVSRISNTEHILKRSNTFFYFS